MFLPALPNELLLDIADHISSPRDLSALTLTSKHFNLLFAPSLRALSLQPVDANTPALTWFSKHGYSKQVSHCLAAGQSMDYHFGSESRTPLHEALAHGYEVWWDREKEWWTASSRAHNSAAFEATVTTLIAAGADLEARDGSGHTPLHAATVRGLVELVRMLLVLGVQVNATDVNGFTPLWYANTYGFREIVELLIEAGAKEVARPRPAWSRRLPRLEVGLVVGGVGEGLVSWGPGGGRGGEDLDGV
ncbi:ankyrin [Tuber magnatum]|uniref:Ankyrin n=1 Tax=Tuber magnatum TaxID=42249 RepID=A0A317SB95_9PEZI|nr:ankyrin [Tuber magnatum]